MIPELLLVAIAAIPAVGTEPRASEGPQTAPRFEFPAGAIQDLAAALALDRAPEPPAPGDLAADWNAPETDERWRAALEAATGPGGRGARARLALLALRQGRADDAWTHATVAGEDPALLAALLPRLLPGIGAGDPVGVGGLAGPLPDGAVLRPATPPRTRPGERGRVERRAMRVRGLRVGEAVLGLRIAVEPEGVQIDVEHQGGGAARLAIQLPVEPGFELGNEYVDWFAAEVRGIPHAIEIRPGDEEHTLYGRFAVAEHAVTFALPPVAPAVVDLGGIAIHPAPSDEGLAIAQALARALAGKPLGLRARVATEPAETRSPPAPGFAPLEVDLRDPRTGAQKLAALCSAIERFVLR